MVFKAETFEEMAELSKAHGTEMFKAQDPAHLEAMSKMRELMKSPEDMRKWFSQKKIDFETLPHD